MFLFSLIDESLLVNRPRLQVMSKRVTHTIEPAKVWATVQQGTLLGWADSTSVVTDRYHNYWVPRLDELLIRPDEDHKNAVYHVPGMGLMMSVANWRWCHQMSEDTIRDGRTAIPAEDHYLLDAIYQGCPRCLEERCSTPIICFSILSRRSVPIEEKPELFPYVDPMLNAIFVEDEDDADAWTLTSMQGEMFNVVQFGNSSHKLQFKSSGDALEAAHSFKHKHYFDTMTNEEYDEVAFFNEFDDDFDDGAPIRQLKNSRSNERENRSKNSASWSPDDEFYNNTWPF